MFGPTPWSKNVLVGAPGAYAACPSIGVDSKGRIRAALNNGPGFEVRASLDAMIFPRVFGFTSFDGIASAPALAIDGSDRAILAWSEFDYSYPSMTGLWAAVGENGTAFTSSMLQAFALPPAGISLGTALDGRVAAGWVQGSTLSIAFTSSDTGRLDSAPLSVRLDVPKTAFVRTEGPIAFDSAGHPIVLVAILPAPTGRSEPPSLALYSPEVGNLPLLSVSSRALFETPLGAVAADRMGRIRFLFTKMISGRTVIFESRSADGVVWTDPARVFDAPSQPSADAPSLAADEAGGFHALFFDTRSGGWLTYAAHAPPGGDFGPADRVSEAEGLENVFGSVSGRATAIAVRKGRAYGLWIDPRGGIYFSTAPLP
jgi:hypothetical protein